MISNFKLALFCVLTLLHFTSVTANESKTTVSCLGNPELQKQKSQRLQEIADADQADRTGPYESIDWNVVTPRDIQRRMEVGAIFGQGCFTSAADFANAAIVYQHGDTADHAFQAFVFANRAVELGDSKQKWLLGSALDRYLTRIGKKQLFATQFSKPFDEKCWCMEPVEESFSEDKRIFYVGKSLEQSLTYLLQLNQNSPECSQAKFCKGHKKSSPQGTVPGFW